MTIWYRLGLPVVIGFAASGFQFMGNKLDLQPQLFTALKQPVSEGVPIGEDNLMPVLMRIDNGAAAADFVPWDGRLALLDTAAARDLPSGRPLSFRDVKYRTVRPKFPLVAYVLVLAREQTRGIELLQIGDQVSFAIAPRDSSQTPELLGRFRVLDFHFGEGGGVALIVGVRMRPGTRMYGPKSERLISASTAKSREQILYLDPHPEIIPEEDADREEVEIADETATDAGGTSHAPASPENLQEAVESDKR